MEPTFFDSFFENLAEGGFSFEQDSLAVALCAAGNAPSVTDEEIGDLQIDTANLVSNVITVTSSSQTDGVYFLALANTELEASGGDVGPFRYAVIYKVSSGALVQFYDLLSDVTIPDTQKVTLIWEDGGLFEIGAA